MSDPTAATPVTSPIQAYLERLHRQLAELDDGKVATYIPQLAKADPRSFGIVIATVDGRVYEVGATRQTFTIQSVSKPLIYGVALEDRGADRVRETVGVEPSGDAFNSISLEPGTGRPLNPMINAGAIAVSSLVAGDSPAARLGRVLGAISAYAGRELAIDDEVFESERSTGHRNRAIGHMLRNYDVIGEDPEPTLELYFKQCSVLVHCRDLALVAATLANGGVNPVSGQRAVAAEHVGAILSVMTTCGMYDFAGEWVHRVGMPAKSGVGGGVIAVLPGQLGIGVFSPALDERGNSVRGVRACSTISRDLGLHFLQPPRASEATLRARYTLADRRSKRRRLPHERAVLERHGRRAVIYELQGDLHFATIERVLREVVDASAELDFAVLDFKRVSHVDLPATRMLAWLVDSCVRKGQQLVLTRVRRGDVLAAFGDELDPRNARGVSFQPQLDLGLEWCERALLQRYGGPSAPADLPDLADNTLCDGLDASDLAHLEARLARRHYEAGSIIVRSGDAADTLFFVLRGEVSVRVDLPGGGVKRLATLSAGMCFGENAVLAAGVRTADVRADRDVECALLHVDDFRRFEGERPRLMVRLLTNLLAASARTVARLTAEVAVLDD